jgi:sugar-specific transcriptional regulator TrmB
MMKICTTCKKQKQPSEFHRQTKGKNGLQSVCKVCVAERQKIYRAENLEKLRETNRRWYHDNVERAKKTSRKYHKENKDKVRELCKKWCEENPEKAREKRLKAGRKYRNTTKGRLNHNIGSGILDSLKQGSKGGHHWESLVNYTVNELKRHLEKQFKDGMTWDNYGTYWHIDHKTPIAVFNYERPDDIDFHICWSLKNLQPLEKTKNLIKNAKIDKPFQPSLAIRV